MLLFLFVGVFLFRSLAPRCAQRRAGEAQRTFLSSLLNAPPRITSLLPIRPHIQRPNGRGLSYPTRPPAQV